MSKKSGNGEYNNLQTASSVDSNKTDLSYIHFYFWKFFITNNNNKLEVLPYSFLHRIFFIGHFFLHDFVLFQFKLKNGQLRIAKSHTSHYSDYFEPQTIYYYIKACDNIVHLEIRHNF